MASRVVSLRLKEEDAAKLDRLARQQQRTPSATAAILLTEKLKEEEFPGIEFRQTAAGRQAYVRGTRVQVWMTLMIARDYGMDVKKTAEHLSWPESKVETALAYARAFPEEIEPIADDVANMTEDEFVRRHPGTIVVRV
jgi:uncharacterized protein (DUF433 family)